MDHTHEIIVIRKHSANAQAAGRVARRATKSVQVGPGLWRRGADVREAPEGMGEAMRRVEPERARPLQDGLVRRRYRGDSASSG